MTAATDFPTGRKLFGTAFATGILPTAGLAHEVGALSFCSLCSKRNHISTRASTQRVGAQKEQQNPRLLKTPAYEKL